jgi:hypothetical protein
MIIATEDPLYIDNQTSACINIYVATYHFNLRSSALYKSISQDNMLSRGNSSPLFSRYHWSVCFQAVCRARTSSFSWNPLRRSRLAFEFMIKARMFDSVRRMECAGSVYVW